MINYIINIKNNSKWLIIINEELSFIFSIFKSNSLQLNNRIYIKNASIYIV
jgi:hypothetical protein